ncbi:MAG: competence protein ComJ [Inquilinus sp.]|uniref:competence protein ComJ n=1 Tax=Inquilinus sp. TaxID=1932117 RepID=UPI003F3921B7
MLAELAVMVDYGQVLIFVQGLPRPGLLWTPDHVAQGFAWAPGIVSFGVPDHDGESLIQVEVASDMPLDVEALWAIRVPFKVPTPLLHIGTVGAMEDVHVPQGSYSLVFEAFPGTIVKEHDYGFVLRLAFCADPDPDFEILRKGGDLTTDRVLRRDAQHA